MRIWHPRLLLSVLLLGTALTGAASAATITGVTMFGVDGGGNADGLIWRSYSNPFGNYLSYLSTDSFASYVNGGPEPFNPATSLAFALPQGSVLTFGIANSGYPPQQDAFYGISLFFDGSMTPGISAVFAAAAPMVFTAASGLVYLLDGGATAPAAGLSYHSAADNSTVTLTQLGITDADGLDLVGPYAATPDGIVDLVGSFTVATVPEPMTALLLAGGLIGLGLARRKFVVPAA